MKDRNVAGQTGEPAAAKPIAAQDIVTPKGYGATLACTQSESDENCFTSFHSSLQCVLTRLN